MNWIGITLFVVATLVSLLLLVYELAKKDILYTFLETGDIKFVVKGKTWVKTLYDVPGFKLNEKGLFEKTDEKPKRPRFGLYPVGIPPFRAIHKFVITKERENPQGKTKEDWVLKGEDEKVSSLRFTFPRPYVFTDVELGDEDPVSIDVLAVSKFEVVDPVKLIFKLKGKFFENVGGIINAAVGDILNDFTLKEFIDADKGELKGILSPLKGEEFNKMLIEQIGLQQVGIAMRYDPANAAVREAMEAKTIAFAKGEATKASADAEYYKGVREGQAIAKTRELRIAATLAGLGGDASAATRVLVAEAHPNVTTEVVGGVSPVIPVGGKP